MDITLISNILLARAEKEMIAKFKRKNRKILKDLRKAKGRNTRAIKNKLCEKMGGTRLKPRKMTFVQRAIYDYMQQYNNLPKCIREQIDA